MIKKGERNVMEPDTFKKVLENMNITRRLISMMTPQAHCITGIFLSSVKTGRKTILSSLCDVTLNAELDLDIATIDKKLDTEKRKFLHDLINLNKINPSKI